MFDAARFVAECEAAIATDGGRDAVREILMAAISNRPGSLPYWANPGAQGSRCCINLQG